MLSSLLFLVPKTNDPSPTWSPALSTGTDTLETENLQQQRVCPSAFVHFGHPSSKWRRTRKAGSSHVTRSNSSRVDGKTLVLPLSSLPRRPPVASLWRHTLQCITHLLTPELTVAVGKCRSALMFYSSPCEGLIHSFYLLCLLSEPPGYTEFSHSPISVPQVVKVPTLSLALIPPVTLQV